MQLKRDVSAAVALASHLQGIPLPAHEEVGAAGSGKGRSPRCLAHAHSSGPQRGEVAKPGLSQGRLSWPEEVADSWHSQEWERAGAGTIWLPAADVER